jgi:glycosyltransferase involved in cell wall biosynthesis
MRIIYYSPHPTHDIVSEVGYSTHQREVINALRQAGHEVETVVMGGDNPLDHGLILEQKTAASPLKKILKLLVPKFIWTSMNNYKLLLHDKNAERRLEETILRKRPDLIYERSEYLQDSGARIATRHGIKYFLEVNAPFVEEMREFEGYSLYQGKAHKIERYKLDAADRIFCVSSALSEFLVRRYECDQAKIILQPNCINPDSTGQMNHDTANIRKDLNIGLERVIGFVGSIFPYHGVDLLIKAFAKVMETNSELKLLIVGDGTIIPELKQLSQELDIVDKVIFAGKIPHGEVFGYIDVMDICVMARSNWYGSPVKIFEYGLMKKPVIAPDTAPVRDVMVHSQTGLIALDEVNSLSSAMLLYLNNRALADSCAANFHRLVTDRYTWQNAAKRIIQECA